MALTAGTKLGPYEIQSLLGAGGMGEVYRARDTRLDRTVAVKILTQGLADTPEVRQRFEREARAVSSFNHPHICANSLVGRRTDVN
jgi:serine/threonine protein kinase